MRCTTTLLDNWTLDGFTDLWVQGQRLKKEIQGGIYRQIYFES